jgi:hypothetical protein
MFLIDDCEIEARKAENLNDMRCGRLDETAYQQFTVPDTKP